MDFFSFQSPALWFVGLTGTAAVFVYLSGMVRYIPNDRIGVVEKLWSASGSVERGLLALSGEALGKNLESNRAVVQVFPSSIAIKIIAVGL
jgi:hypothetical protein